MDPKKNPQQLDPKLKEIYDRVMGTQVKAAAAHETKKEPEPQKPHEIQSTPVHISPQPAPTAPAMPTQPSMPVAHAAQQTVMTAQPPQATATDLQQKASSGFVAGGHGNNTDGKSGSSVSPVLLVLVGIVFFIVYAIFWIKIFAIPLPFTLPF